MQRDLHLEELMPPNDLASYRDWRGQHGASVFLRALSLRLAETREEGRRKMRLNPEDCRSDFRWNLATVETLEGVIGEIKGTPAP